MTSSISPITESSPAAPPVAIQSTAVWTAATFMPGSISMAMAMAMAMGNREPYPSASAEAEEEPQ